MHAHRYTQQVAMTGHTLINQALVLNLHSSNITYSLIHHITVYV